MRGLSTTYMKPILQELISCSVVDSRFQSGIQQNFLLCNKVYTVKGKDVSVMKTYGEVET